MSKLVICIYITLALAACSSDKETHPEVEVRGPYEVVPEVALARRNADAAVLRAKIAREEAIKAIAAADEAQRKSISK